MPGVLHHLPADDRVRVVERRQAVHELHPAGCRSCSSSAVFTWYGASSRPARPTRPSPRPSTPTRRCGRSRRRDTACAGVVGDRDPRAGARRRCPWRSPPRRRAAPGVAGPAEADVGAHQRAHHEQRAAHVVPAVADERVRQRVVGLAAGLVHREEVGQHLRRVPLVRQPVVDGHAGVGGELLDVGLGVAAELDGVVHPAEHPRRVGDRLLVAELRSRRDRGRSRGRPGRTPPPRTPTACASTSSRRSGRSPCPRAASPRCRRTSPIFSASDELQQVAQLPRARSRSPSGSCGCAG